MNARQKRRKRARNDGLTLLELIIAVFITLLITAIAIPMMVPSLEQRQLRETSRVITSHFQGARTRGIQQNKFFGVMIEPQSSLQGAGVTLSYMAESEPWDGDFSDSRVHIVGNIPPPWRLYGLIDHFIDSAGIIRNPPESGWIGLIRPGDLIQFGGAGRRYEISSGEPFTDTNGNGVWNTGEPFANLDGDTGYDAGEPFTDLNGNTLYDLGEPFTDSNMNGFCEPGEPFRDLNANGTWDVGEPFSNLDGDTGYDGPQLGTNGTIRSLPWTIRAVSGSPIPSSGYNDVDGNGAFNQPPDELFGSTFRVFRQPTKTAAHPLQLPNARVVDLAHSGTPGLPTLYDTAPAVNIRGPITVIFTPSGALASINYYEKGFARSISPSGPLFLLVGKVEKIGNTAVGERNFEDMSNFWVSIHPQTGLVTSTEVGPDGSDAGTDISLSESRHFALRGLALGGR